MGKGELGKAPIDGYMHLVVRVLLYMKKNYIISLCSISIIAL